MSETQSGETKKFTHRALKSFGVAGLMAEECEIAHVLVFNSHHLGRISDLIAGFLREHGVEEFRLRNLLQFGVYQALQNGITRNQAKPLGIECAVDGEKASLSILCSLDRKQLVKVEGLKERIMQRAPSDLLEKFLVQLYLHSDQLILRYQPDTRRFEVGVCLEKKTRYGTSLEQDPISDKKLPPIWVSFEQHEIIEAPSAKKYFHLADLDVLEVANDTSSSSLQSVSGKSSSASDMAVFHTETFLQRGKGFLSRLTKALWPKDRALSVSKKTEEKIDPVQEQVVHPVPIVPRTVDDIFGAPSDSVSSDSPSSPKGGTPEPTPVLSESKQEPFVDQDVILAEYDHKISLFQKLLKKEKEEKELLAQKLLTLKAEMTKEQGSGYVKKGLDEEIQRLHAKIKLQGSQMEELRKLNRLMVEQMKELKRSRLDLPDNQADTRRKLEAAMKLVISGRKEIESLNEKITQLQKQEVTLKMELNRLEYQLSQKNSAA